MSLFRNKGGKTSQVREPSQAEGLALAVAGAMQWSHLRSAVNKMFFAGTMASSWAALQRRSAAGAASRARTAFSSRLIWRTSGWTTCQTRASAFARGTSPTRTQQQRSCDGRKQRWRTSELGMAGDGWGRLGTGGDGGDGWGWLGTGEIACNDESSQRMKVGIVCSPMFHDVEISL